MDHPFSKRPWMCHSLLVLASPRHFHRLSCQSTKFSSTTWSLTGHCSTSRLCSACSNRDQPRQFPSLSTLRSLLGHAFCCHSIYLLSAGSLKVRNPLGLFEVASKTEAVRSVVRRTVRDHFSDQDLREVLLGGSAPAGMPILFDDLLPRIPNFFPVVVPQNFSHHPARVLHATASPNPLDRWLWTSS